MSASPKLEALEIRSLLSPAVSSASFDYQSGPAFRYTFSADIDPATLQPEDFVLYYLTHRTTVPPSKVSVSYDASSRAATFSFTGFAGNTPRDANYQAM